MCHDKDQLPTLDRGALETELGVPVTSTRPMPTHLQDAKPGARIGAVVIITDIYGATPFYRGLAARLAESGFTTAVPDYLLHQVGDLEKSDRDHAIARARGLDQQRALIDVGAVADWLKRKTNTNRVGLIGFCLGGTFALDLAAQRHDLAVVSLYGFPDGVAGTNPVPAPMSIIDQIAGPILGLWGEEDYMGMDRVRAFCAGVAAHNPQFESHIYPGVGHGFLSELASDDESAAHAWSRTTQFLAGQLSSSQTGS